MSILHTNIKLSKPVAIVLWLLVLHFNCAAQDWVKLFDAKPFPPSQFKEFKGDLYGLIFDSNNKYDYFVKWNGTDFCKPIDNGDSIKMSDYAYAMCVFKGQIIVSSKFKTKSGRVLTLAGWDGHFWHPVGSGIYDSITAMSVYHDTLYVNRGYDIEHPSPYIELSKWDGQNWSSVKIGPGSKRRTKDNGFLDMAVYKDELYVTGSFDSINHVAYNNIARWNGSKWDSLASGVAPTFTAPVRDLKTNLLQVFRNELYVSTTANCNSTWSKWDGIKWNKLKYEFQWLNQQWVSFWANYNDSFLYVVAYDCFFYKGHDSNWSQDFTFDINHFPWMVVHQNKLYAAMYDSFVQWNPNHYKEYHNPYFSNIYPNPAINSVTIETYYPNNDMEYELYNSAGQKLLSGKLAEYNCCQQINVEPYPPGMYLIRLKSGDSWEYHKIIVEK